MIENLLALALLVPPSTPTDREWSASRPSRGVHARVVTAAAVPPPGWAAFAECVEWRESKGHAGIVNGGGYMGLFQFGREWNGSLHFVVSRRLAAFGVSAPVRRIVRDYLDHLPINRWPAVYQRIGFAQVLTEGGWRHWHLSGSRCELLVN